MRGQPFRLHIKNVTFKVDSNVAGLATNSDLKLSSEQGGGNRFNNFCIKTMKTVVTMDNVNIEGYGGRDVDAQGQDMAADRTYGGACLIQGANYSVIDKDITRLNYDISNNNPQYMAGKPGLNKVTVINCNNSIELRNCYGSSTDKLYVTECTVDSCTTNGLVLGDGAHMNKLAAVGGQSTGIGNSSADLEDVKDDKCAFIIVDKLTVSASNRAVVMESCSNCTLKNSTLHSNHDGILVGSPTGENYLDSNTTHSGKIDELGLGKGAAYDNLDSLRHHCSINLIQ